MDSTLAGRCPSDDDLARWLDRAGSSEVAAALELHVDLCSRCRRFLAALAGPAQAESERTGGARFGRYEIRGVLGAGGMGVVYRAYDPELAREVALKRVRGHERGTDQDRARLLREARALARLRHPAIVPVFDVGDVDGELFFAMELVRGKTLDARLREGGLTWREAIAVLLPAAEGLAAAHAAGLVHRDFKPANVILADDGRTLVMDFGLARERGGASAASTRTTSPRDGPESDAAVTRDGSVVGTPLYMSPEQFLAQPADARSDQFAFCVVLFETLQGRHPWQATSLAELGARVVSGEIAPMPRRIPRWLDRAVRRGLRVDASERHASMEALVAELRRGLRSRAPQWVALACVLAVAAAAVWLGRDGAGSSCAAPDSRMEAIWSPAVRDRIAKMPNATLGAAFGAGLDDYVRTWHELRRSACEASDDGRLACLARGRAAVSALVEGLETTDAPTISRALDALDALPPLERCTGLESDPLAPEPARATQVAELRERQARVTTLAELGDVAGADALAQQLVVEARALDFAPVLAETLLAAAAIAGQAGAPARGRQLAEEAFELAAGIGHARVEAEAAIEMVSESLATSDPDRARVWLRHARARIDRGGLAATTSIDLDAIEAHVIAIEGRPADALERALAAFDAYETALGSTHRKTIDALVQVARLQRELARWGDALATYDRVEERVASRWGPDHPLSATLANNRGAVLADAGRLEEAIPHFERGLRIREATLGPRHLVVAGSLNNLANVLHARGRDAEAVAMYERALSLWQEQLGPEHVVLAGGWRNVAISLGGLGRHADALVARDRALEIARRHFADDDPRQAVDVCGRAETLVALHRIAEARGEFARCVPVLEKLPAGHPDREHAVARANELRSDHG
jgi:tetratricopeptide (TPR) repeat protein/predicted Ser/Thr protein kinase